MKKHRALIFDLDGTLVDTLGDIAASMNRALSQRGFPELPVKDFAQRVGWGSRRLAYLCLPEEVRNEDLAAQISEEATVYYAQEPLVHSRVYPGILEAVAALGQKKIITAVLTNKPDPVAQKVIAGLFGPQAFTIVQGEVPGRARKPDPGAVWDMLVELGLNPADTIFFGDSEIDMETALASGCYPLGCSWGYRSREAIMEAGARRIIDDPAEILEFF
ncbi:MAG: HAD family hydrolase [Treponema sp.]|nr:HAD family hydrolase [Treponema sp.]